MTGNLPLQDVIDSMEDLIYFKDRDSRYIGCNRAFVLHVGLPVDSIIGHLDTDFPDLQAPSLYRARDLQVMLTKQPLVTEDWLVHHTLGKRLYEIVKTPFGDHSQPCGVIGVARDITNHWRIKHRDKTRQAALELIAKHAPLADILNAIVAGLEAEMEGRLCSILLLDEASNQLVCGAAPSLPAFYNEVVEHISPAIGAGACGTAIATGERVIVEDINTHPYWVDYRAAAQQAGLAACWSQPIFSASGKVLGSFAIYHRHPTRPEAEDLDAIEQAASITGLAIEYHQDRQQLERQARIDRLTGLANRHFFHEQAEKALAKHHLTHTPISLLFIDVDFFKRINDRFGHAVGDQTLATLGEYLASHLRPADIVARMGGEEFAILLPDTDAEEAVQISQRLQQQLPGFYAEKPDLKATPTLSIGIATFRQGGGSLDQLLSRADTALYDAKHQGRNCTVLFLPITD